MKHHSSAPWHGNERLASHVRTIWSDDGTFVAAVVHPDIPTAPLDEQEANVPLLIAAPDLLAACRLALDWEEGRDCGCHNVNTVTGRLHDAIAKAEGRKA